MVQNGIVGYFILLFLSTLVLKLAFPSTAYSSLTSFYNTFLGEYVFWRDNYREIISVTFVAIQLFELAIVVLAFQKSRYFILVTTIFLTFALLYMLYSILYDLPVDCGCFGGVVSLEFTANKIIFLGANLLFLFYLKVTGAYK